jgi:hypothetical protein
VSQASTPTRAHKLGAGAVTVAAGAASPGVVGAVAAALGVSVGGVSSASASVSASRPIDNPLAGLNVWLELQSPVKGAGGAGGARGASGASGDGSTRKKKRTGPGAGAGSDGGLDALRHMYDDSDSDSDGAGEGEEGGADSFSLDNSYASSVHKDALSLLQRAASNKNAAATTGSSSSLQQQQQSQLSQSRQQLGSRPGKRAAEAGSGTRHLRAQQQQPQGCFEEVEAPAQSNVFAINHANAVAPSFCQSKSMMLVSDGSSVGVVKLYVVFLSL